MVKKLLYVLIALVILGLIGFGFALYRANDLIVKFKPDIEKAASEALDARVSLGTLNVSVFPSCVVTVDELRVKTTENSDSAFTLKNIKLDVNLFALLSKRLEISELTIVQPEILAIKTADGVEIVGLPKGKKEPKPPTSADIKTRENKQAEHASSLAINLERIQVKNGRFTLHDQVSNQDQAVTDINLVASTSLSNAQLAVSSTKLSATLPGKIAMELSSRPIQVDLNSGDVKLEGMELTLAGSKVNITGSASNFGQSANLSITSSDINVAPLAAAGSTFAPIIETMKFSGRVAPALQLTYETKSGLKYKISGPVEVHDLSMELPWAGGKQLPISKVLGAVFIDGNQDEQTVTGKDLGLAIGGAPAKLSFATSLDKQSVSVKDMILSAFGGTTSFELFRLNLDAAKAFSVGKASVRGVKVDDALPILMPNLASMIAGTLTSLDISVSGNLAGNVAQSLRAPGNIIFSKGALKGFNLAGAVLKKVDKIPLLTGTLMYYVPANYKPLLESSDTPIEDLRGAFNLTGMTLSMNDMNVRSDIFELKSNGSAAMGGDMDLDSTISFTYDFSQALTHSAKEIKSILSSDGRLVLPLNIRGTPPLLIVTPNVEEVLTLAAKRIGKDKAADAIDRALGNRLGESGKEGVKKALGNILGF